MITNAVKSLFFSQSSHVLSCIYSSVRATDTSVPALNWRLTCRQDVQCVEEVKELLLDRCEKSAAPSVTEQLEKILGDTSKPVGLLLSERFVNVPPQIALPLHKHLQ